MPGKRESVRVTWRDVREVTHLLASLTAFVHGSATQLQHFLESANRLVNARVGVVLRAVERPGQPHTQQILHAWGWVDDGEQAFFRQDAVEHRYRANPFIRPFLDATATPGKPVACTRQQMVDDASWYRAEYVQTSFRALRIDDVLVGAARHGNDSAPVWIGFLRDWGDRIRFSRRECKLTTLMTEAMATLLARTPDATGVMESGRSACGSAVRLSKRLQEVRSLLLQGLSEKQVAGRLQLSPATVHRHVNRLYSMLGISSRAELFAYSVRKS